jgi:hypothetical protein
MMNAENPMNVATDGSHHAPRRAVPPKGRTGRNVTRKSANEYSEPDEERRRSHDI